MHNTCKVVFFGSNQYSVVILKKLLELKEFQVTAVVTKPDAPVGRDQKITANPMAEFTHQYVGTHDHALLQLFQPTDFDQSFFDKFKSLQPDLAICVAYGPPFFTQEMIDIPKYKIINLHPSPLPHYRGAAPGPWQIINGENTSAMSFFVIDDKPDHGPVISQIPFAISPTETSTSFYDKAFSLGADNLELVIKNYLKNPQNLQPQDHTQKTYFPKLNKDSGRIDWNKSPEYNERFIRAMQPWPIAWSELTDQNGQKKRVQILSSQLRSGKLLLDQVKIEGKQAASWSDIQSHYRLV